MERPPFGLAPTPATAVAEAAPLFALGRRLDDEGRYDEAFAAFAKGNTIVRASKDIEAFARNDDALVDQVRTVFTPSMFRLFESPPQRCAPIFIVGMPRSGSSLIEQ